MTGTSATAITAALTNALPAPFSLLVCGWRDHIRSPLVCVLLA
jgi:hypothetical protein